MSRAFLRVNFHVTFKIQTPCLLYHLIFYLAPFKYDIISQWVNQIKKSIIQCKMAIEKNIISFIYLSFLLPSRPCMHQFQGPLLAWLYALFSGLKIKQAIFKDYCPAWSRGVKANHNASCNYFNNTRCNMLWSVEKGVINYLHRLYFHFFFFCKNKWNQYYFVYVQYIQTHCQDVGLFLNENGIKSAAKVMMSVYIWNSVAVIVHL